MRVLLSPPAGQHSIQITFGFESCRRDPAGTRPGAPASGSQGAGGESLVAQIRRNGQKHPQDQFPIRALYVIDCAAETKG